MNTDFSKFDFRNATVRQVLELMAPLLEEVGHIEQTDQPRKNALAAEWISVRKQVQQENFRLWEDVRTTLQRGALKGGLSDLQIEVFLGRWSVPVVKAWREACQILGWTTNTGLRPDVCEKIVDALLERVESQSKKSSPDKSTMSMLMAIADDKESRIIETLGRWLDSNQEHKAQAQKRKGGTAPKATTTTGPTLEQQIAALEAEAGEAAKAKDYTKAGNLQARADELKAQMGGEEGHEDNLSEQIAALEAEAGEAAKAKDYTKAGNLQARADELKAQMGGEESVTESSTPDVDDLQVNLQVVTPERKEDIRNIVAAATATTKKQVGRRAPRVSLH